MVKRDLETKQEYLLLRNYNEIVQPMRGLLFAVAMKSINQTGEGKFLLGNISSEKDKVKAMQTFQLEIISSIMLYIEDLIVLSESFRRGISYYKLLHLSDKGKIDLGKIIKEFFENMNSFSDEEFRTIFGYADPNQLDLNEKERKLAKKVIQRNIVEMRKVFVKIEMFGKTHHPVFKRFKHGGAPLLFDAEVKIQGDFPFSESDSYIMVSSGEDPLEDVIPVPLSKDILTGYGIVVSGIQYCLFDLVTNRIACIERNLTGIIPYERYFPEDLSKKETDLYVQILKKFVVKYPSHMDGLLDFSFSPKITKEQVRWYHNLPNLLRESREISKAAGKSS